MEEINAQKMAAGKPLGKLSFVLRDWQDNIKVDFTEIGCENGNCVVMAEGRVQRQTSVLAILNLML
jgi:hypothetical protein